MLAALFFASLPAFNRYNVDEIGFSEASAGRLGSFRGRHGEKGLRVLAIGSSLMGKAVFFDGRMEALAKRQGLTGIEFMRISRPDGDLSTFMPLLSDMAEAAPDIILIESDSVFYDRHMVKNAFAREYMSFLKAMLMESLKSKRPVFPKPEQVFIENDFDLPVKSRLNKVSLDETLLKWDQRSLADIEEIAPFFSDLARRGIKAVLVSIPRHPEFERLAGGHGPETAVLQKRLERYYGVKSISFQGEAGAECYSDHAHLNGEGRLRFSLWLIEVLKGGRGVV